MRDLIFSGLVLIVFAIPSAADEPTSREDVSAREALLIERLNDPSLWKAGKERLLHAYLREARLIHSKALVPPLLAHLEYAEKTRLPVVDALADFDVQVVPYLLDLIQETDPAHADKADRQRWDAAIRCLCSTYDRDGFGREMARTRIELQLRWSSEPRRKNLQAALESDWLR